MIILGNDKMTKTGLAPRDKSETSPNGTASRGPLPTWPSSASQFPPPSDGLTAAVAGPVVAGDFRHRASPERLLLYVVGPPPALDSHVSLSVRCPPIEPPPASVTANTGVGPTGSPPHPVLCAPGVKLPPRCRARRRRVPSCALLLLLPLPQLPAPHLPQLLLLL